MRLWPFVRRHSEEHEQAKRHLEEVRRRQKRVELELRTIAVQANRQRGR